MYKVLEMKFDIFPDIKFINTSKLRVSYLLDPSAASHNLFELHDM